MGQGTSTESEGFLRKTVTNDELLKLFTKECSKHLQPIELLSIRNNMKDHDKDHNEDISELEFMTLLGFQEHYRIVTLLYTATQFLGRFPFINHNYSQGLNFHGLLKAITLFNQERYSKVLTKSYDYTKLIFLAFANHVYQTTKEVIDTQPDTQTIPLKNGHVSWIDSSIVSEYDGIDIDEAYIIADDVLVLFSFLLVISRLESHESLKHFETNFQNFDSYKTHALPILVAINPNINQQNLKEVKIHFSEFREGLLNIAPNLLNPLSNVLDHLLYYSPKTEEKESIIQPKRIHTESKLINEFTLAQLSTFLKKELVYSNIRKLYVGSDSGFSMRSFESKAFKWNAPSILLIKGSRISSKTNNPRYKKFEQDFPKFQNESLPNQNANDVLVYGIYVDQPWRITNKDTFGSRNTILFQLSPIQKIFHPSISAKNLIYFNTVGGGIGIGSPQPSIKNNFKRYNPGNVSLTIDSTLEFAVFRNLGLGGEFKSVDVNDSSLEYEDRFLISNVEVWGCGGEKELEEQNKRWEWEQNEVKRRQQINLKSLGEDRALLEMAGLVGQNQSGGSV